MATVTYVSALPAFSLLEPLLPLVFLSPLSLLQYLPTHCVYVIRLNSFLHLCFLLLSSPCSLLFPLFPPPAISSLSFSLLSLLTPLTILVCSNVLPCHLSCVVEPLQVVLLSLVPVAAVVMHVDVVCYYFQVERGLSQSERQVKSYVCWTSCACLLTPNVKRVGQQACERMHVLVVRVF